MALDLNIAKVYGPLKRRGYQVEEGTHKTCPEKDFWWVRFKDGTAITFYRSGDFRIQRN